MAGLAPCFAHGRRLGRGRGGQRRAVAIAPAGAMLALSASIAVSIYLLAGSPLIRGSHQW